MLNEKQIDARMEAYEQVIGHLCLAWTDDKDEIEQGHILADQLRNQADKWFFKIMQNKVKK